jgi:hypothetical protein
MKLVIVANQGCSFGDPILTLYSEDKVEAKLLLCQNQPYDPLDEGLIADLKDTGETVRMLGTEVTIEATLPTYYAAAAATVIECAEFPTDKWGKKAGYWDLLPEGEACGYGDHIGVPNVSSEDEDGHCWECVDPNCPEGQWHAIEAEDFIAVGIPEWMAKSWVALRDKLEELEGE